MARFFIALILLLTAQNSWSYYSTMDTAELVPEGQYKLNVETQFITEGDSGMNLIGRFDKRINTDSSYRVEVGFGVIDFQIAGFYKWSPVPDTGNQPAMSVSGGISIANVDSYTDLSIRTHPIISKQFDVDFGALTPYASVPLGIRTLDGETDLTAQLALGSFLKPTKYEKMSFALELGFDLSKAFTYISFGFTLDLDPEEGVVFR